MEQPDLTSPLSKGSVTRLDRFTSNRSVLLLTCLYSLGVVLMSCLGTTGPNVFKHIDADSASPGMHGSSVWKLEDANCKEKVRPP